MHSRWRSKSNTLNSMEREMGRCPTRKHASKKRPILFLNTNGVAFNPVVKIGILYIVQVAWFGHMTRVMPQNHRHLQPFGGLLRILHSGEFKKFLGKPLKYAPFVILSVWQSEQSISRSVSGWKQLPKCQACSLENAARGRFLCPHGPRQVKWISSWHCGMRRDDGVDLVGVQFWKMEIFTGFGLLGSTGCGEIYFWEAILDQVGQETALRFKMENWARKIISSE